MLTLPIAFRTALCALSLSAIAASAIAQTSAAVTVNSSEYLRPIPALGMGINSAVWDGLMTDPAVPGLVKSLGVQTLRYPGGSTSDVFHWQSNTLTAGFGTSAGNTDFDSFMSVAQAVGAQPIITVNYGSNAAGTGGGDPAEAAAWVNYANDVKKYGVKYWEIGNEIYGNGEYDGVQWETDLHTSHSPATYGDNVLLFAKAMKLEDPSIKIGAVLTAPGYWPDGVSPDWNSGVLSVCGSSIDFVIVHWYAQNPGQESDSGLLSSVSEIGAMVAKTQALIDQYCGSNAPNVQIFVTETNSVSSSPGKQSVGPVNPLFAANDLLQWQESGVANVDWWDLHNGPVTNGNNSSSLSGNADFGDYGLLSVGGSTEPPADTPFPSYYGLEMAHLLGNPGDMFVSASSSDPNLASYAVKQANGNLTVLLINNNPSQADEASLDITGYKAAPNATEYLYGQNSSSVTQSQIAIGASPTVTVAPYSMSLLVFQPIPLVSISGTVALQNVAAGDLAQPMTFTLTPTGLTGGGVITQTTTLDPQTGAYTISGIPAGTYVMGAKGAKWLRQDQSINTNNGSLTGVNFSLLGGDANGDNQVTLGDVLVVRQAFGSKPGMANWNPNADLNCDGQVTLSDVLLIRINFGKQGNP